MSMAASMTPAALPEARVLVADDSPINQTVTRSMLEHLGLVEIDVAGDGSDALDLASSHDYDLILMDCQMPVMDGYEAARRIREREASAARSSRVPIVALSGKVMTGDRERCLDFGMDDCLAKPYQLAGLRACLERWLG